MKGKCRHPAACQFAVKSHSNAARSTVASEKGAWRSFNSYRLGCGGVRLLLATLRCRLRLCALFVAYHNQKY